MGQHYVNFDLVGDPTIDPAQARGARLRAAGQRHVQARRPRMGPGRAQRRPRRRRSSATTCSTGPAPNRYGIEPGFYERHYWLYQTNPLGAFEDWNPTCPAAATATTAADRRPGHHGRPEAMTPSGRHALGPSGRVPSGDDRSRRRPARHRRRGPAVQRPPDPPDRRDRLAGLLLRPLRRRAHPVRARPVHDHRGHGRRQARSSGPIRWRRHRSWPATRATSSTSGWSRAGCSPRSCGRCRSARACG